MNDDFHVSVHARPAELSHGGAWRWRGVELQTLAVDPRRLATHAFDQSFEDTLAQLASFERMVCEPDGSFVWASSMGASSAGAADWQLDGCLFDRQGKLLFVDLKGHCPAAPFDALLRALGWPRTPVMFQLIREAIFLDEAEFRRAAAC